MTSDGRLQRIKNEVQQAKARWDELRRTRDERQRELEKLRSRHDEIRQEVMAGDLVPGSPSDRDHDLAEEVAELEETIAELEDEEAEAKQRWEELEQRRQELVRERLPDRADDLAQAKKTHLEKLERLGREAADRYVEDLLPARENQRRQRAELDNLLSQLTAVDGERRLLSRQKRELRNWVEETTRDVSPEAILGFILVEVLRWTRRASSPLEDYWSERDLPQLEGSILHEAPIPALQDTVAKLRNDQVPV